LVKEWCGDREDVGWKWTVAHNGNVTAQAHLTTSLSAGTILLGLSLGFKATYIGLGLECSGLGINHKAIRHGI